MDLYREIILDHYKHPRNFGHLDHSDVKIEEGNVACGDRISMEISFNKKQEVEDIRFSGEGCAISMASASMLTELAKGKSIKSVMKLGQEDITRLLNTTLTPSRTKCAMLSLEVLQKGILSLKK